MKKPWLSSKLANGVRTYNQFFLSQIQSNLYKETTQGKTNILSLKTNGFLVEGHFNYNLRAEEIIMQYLNRGGLLIYVVSRAGLTICSV